MIPSQTSQIFIGTVVALLYAGAVMAIGSLLLRGVIGRHASAKIYERLGLFGFHLLGFVTGQGILGVVWLGLSLGEILYPSLVWMVCVLGWTIGIAVALGYRKQIRRFGSLNSIEFWSLFDRQSWYVWVGLGLIIILLLHGVIALLPTENDDALHWYLTVARVIADSHALNLQPFVTPHNGLYPLQVEMHWSALFAISNETAVFVWDYLCALSLLGSVGLLAWALTSNLRVVLLTVLLLLSTPGFYELMGRGKADIAAAQYGVAAFLWLTVWPVLGRRSAVLAGLCAGWAMAGRYTNVIILPGLLLFFVMLVLNPWGGGVEVENSGKAAEKFLGT